MTTADTKSSSAGEHVIEQRLDALDRALLGLLPRSERLTIVTQVETRVRELVSSNPAAISSTENAAEPVVTASAASRSSSAATSKRRSRLALSSGILGITALAMLFAMPITYLFVVTIGEELDEMISYSLLAIHILAVAVGGLVALAMGIAGLVSLARRKGQLVGHGWAITGLCTAPLPTLVGGLMVLVTSLSLLATSAISVESSSSPREVVSTTTYYPSPAATCGPSTDPYCAPASAMPASISLPLPVRAAPACAAPICSAAPAFCAPAAASPQPVSSGPTLPQEQINWKTDIEQALKQAKEEKKLVLVHFYGDSCPPCRAVEQKVFPQPQVVQAMMRNYVPVKINVDEDQKTAARYAVRAIPTDVFLVGETGQEAHRELTKQSAAEYATLLENQAIRTGSRLSDSVLEDPVESQPAPAPRTRLEAVPAGSPVAPAPSNAAPPFVDRPSLR